jgi:hypothetical protein
VNTLPLSGDGGLLGVLAGLTDPRMKRGVRHQVPAVRSSASNPSDQKGGDHHAATLTKALPVL